MKNVTLKNIGLGGAVIFTVTALILIGVQLPRATAGEKATSETTTETAAATTAPDPGVKIAKGGSQLWSENCARCHNMRSPSTYSDTEWDVVMHHMRVRANLTPQEHKMILEFLQSAN